MLQLHKTESEDGASAAQEYGEFMHAPRKRFTDYGEFRFLHSSFLQSQLVMVGHMFRRAVMLTYSGVLSESIFCQETSDLSRTD